MKAAEKSHPELLCQLTERIIELSSSEKWYRYLDYQSKFRSYSPSNVMLIAMQREGATWVAGFAKWKELGRTVLKGEKAIWILAPMIYKEKRAAKNLEKSEGTDLSDVAPDELIKDLGKIKGQSSIQSDESSKGHVSSRSRAARVCGFKFVPVFDVSSTQGAELPSICDKLKGEDSMGLFAKLNSVAESIGYTVSRVDLPQGINGDCAHSLKQIRVESSNSAIQQVKTLAHELAHALLHENCKDRMMAELEAESVAYIVCQSFGVDSADYSFGYIASWAGSGEKAASSIKESCERIQRAAAEILLPIEKGRRILTKIN